jgi:CRP-like cAMP-binding protein
VGLLATLPGETLARLSERMRREPVAPGRPVADTDERFYVLLSGVVTGTDPSGARIILHPGEVFAGAALGTSLTPATTLRALTPAVVASADRELFEEHIRPLLEEQTSASSG